MFELSQHCKRMMMLHGGDYDEDRHDHEYEYDE